MKKRNINYKLVLTFLLIIGFLSCKRSIFHKTDRDFDAKLVKKLRSLEHHYTNKKVRINTWDQKSDAYLDLVVLNEDNKPIQTLTIGDSVKFISLDFSQPEGIRAEIEITTTRGYVPYSKVEEFGPATYLDPDLKE